MSSGWMGVMRELTFYLSVVGADRDEQGRFLVRGGIATFLGQDGENAEVVVDGAAEYRLDDRWANLSAGLRGTSYGLGVTVI